MAANRVQFAIPGLCIEAVWVDSYFIIHFGMFSSQPFFSISLIAFLPVICRPISLIIALPNQTSRSHHCISRRIYTMFPRDSVHEVWPGEDGDSSCGESDGDSDHGFENLPPSPTAQLSTRVSGVLTDSTILTAHSPPTEPLQPCISSSTYTFGSSLSHCPCFAIST
jgi:hypothetical protein